MKITFAVPGKPQGKSRPRFARGRTYTPKNTVDYENKIRSCFREKYACNGSTAFGSRPVSVSLLILYPIPKSTPKKTVVQMLSDLLRPLKKPDGDNVEKAILDALNGAAYDDDKQVVDVHWQKFYAHDEAHSGLVVTVSDECNRT